MVNITVAHQYEGGKKKGGENVICLCYGARDCWWFVSVYSLHQD